MKVIFDLETETITGWGRYSAEEMDDICVRGETWFDVAEGIEIRND